MDETRQRDAFYMLFAIQFTIIGSEGWISGGGLLELFGVGITVVVLLREGARQAASLLHSEGSEWS